MPLLDETIIEDDTTETTNPEGVTDPLPDNEPGEPSGPDTEEEYEPTYTEGADYVTPKSLTSFQLEKLLDSDSPYIQQARQAGTEQAASRGLLNSTIAAGTAEREAIRQALPIAQEDAATYREAEAARQGYEYERTYQESTEEHETEMQQTEIEAEFGLQAGQFEQELKLQKRQFGHEDAFAAAERAFQKAMQSRQFSHEDAMAEAQFAYDSALADQAFGNQLVLNDQAFGHNMALQDSRYAYEMAMQSELFSHEDAMQFAQFTYDQALQTQAESHQFGMQERAYYYDMLMQTGQFDHETAMQLADQEFEKIMAEEDRIHEMAMQDSMYAYEEALQSNQFDHEQAQLIAQYEYEITLQDNRDAAALKREQTAQDAETDRFMAGLTSQEKIAWDDLQGRLTIAENELAESVRQFDEETATIIMEGYANSINNLQEQYMAGVRMIDMDPDMTPEAKDAAKANLWDALVSTSIDAGKVWGLDISFTGEPSSGTGGGGTGGGGTGGGGTGGGGTGGGGTNTTPPPEGFSDIEASRMYDAAMDGDYFLNYSEATVRQAMNALADAGYPQNITEYEMIMKRNGITDPYAIKGFFDDVYI